MDEFLVKCFAGCEVEDIVQALGLTLADLFNQANGHAKEGRDPLPPESRATVQHVPGCTLEQYAEAKNLPISFLQSLGIKDSKWNKIASLRIPYRNKEGVEIAVRFRTGLHKGKDGTDDRFCWKSGSKAQLYGLWRLPQDKSTLIVVEGESDCHTLWFHGFHALGIPGASCLKPEWEDYLKGFGGNLCCD